MAQTPPLAFPLLLAQEDAAPSTTAGPSTPATAGGVGGGNGAASGNAGGGTPSGSGTAAAPGSPSDAGNAQTLQPAGGGQGGVGPGTGGGQDAPGFFSGPMMIFLVFIGVMWFMLMFGQRRDKKKRQAMLDAVKKGDQVQTVGGLLGTVVEVRDSEIVIKADENTNTRLRFSKSAVQAVLPGKEDK